jgi:hypothetical protein
MNSMREPCTTFVVKIVSRVAMVKEDDTGRVEICMMGDGALYMVMVGERDGWVNGCVRFR